MMRMRVPMPIYMSAPSPAGLATKHHGNTAVMITFFILLVVLMVLVAAAGSWAVGPRRRIYYDRGPVDEYVEEEIPRRRLVRRRRSTF